MGLLGALGLAVGAAGSILGSKSSNKAAKKAADVSLQVADKNNALAREIFGKNEGYLAPYAQQGLPASYALNSFLGLTPTQQPAQPQPNAQFSGQTYGFEGLDGPGRFYSSQEPEVFNLNGYNYNAPGGGIGGGQPQAQPQVSGRDAFRTFLDNSDYGFQFQEGSNALNSGYAGRGLIQSGAAMKDLEKYRQNLQSGYRGEFLNLLGNQQGVGLGGASALAGVGQNFVNTISNNNNSAGTAQANAALAKQNPFANALSLVGGGLFGLGK
jgi:hypothetical protein